MNSEVEFIVNQSGRAFDYTEEEVAVVVESMKYADPLTQGSYLKQFEKDFASYNTTRNSFAVTNCTNALDLAAILSGLEKGDEVIIPAHTYCATAIPFGRTGARIVWADIDPKTRLISAETIEKVISLKTKVIVVVHLYGLMPEMDPIMDISRRYGCLVVEDCAQSMGAEYRGNKAGSIGDFGTFSFHCQKSITTLGEGGMLTVKSDETAKLVPGLRHNGGRPFDEEREHYWIPAMSNVDLDIEGVWPYNFSLGEPQCALGSLIIRRLDKMNDFRIKRAEAFKDSVKDYPELSFQEVSEHHKHVYHLLSAKYDNKDSKRSGKTNHDLIKLLAYKYKIKMIVQYYPLYRYPLFQKMGFGEADCPHTDDFYDNMVSFPFHYWMSDTQFEYMIDSTLKALKSLRN